MAHFVRDTGDDLNPIHWSNEIFYEHIKSLVVDKGMMGKMGSGRPIVMDRTLEANAGDTKRFTFIPYVSGTRIRGQDTMVTGNENSYNEFSLDVTVDEINIPFARKGKMTEQRTLYDTRKILSKMISTNFAQYNEETIFKVLSGVSFDDDDSATYLGAADATDRVNGDNRCIRANGANDSTEVDEDGSDTAALLSAMTTADKLSPTLIDDAVIMARTANSSSNDTSGSDSNTYKLKPLRITEGNDEVFMLYVSLKAARDLRRNDDWLAHAYSLAERGFEKSPLAKGALGVWNNVIIKSAEHVLECGTAGTEVIARNLLVGADAMLCAWAQTLDYTEELEDHGRRLSVNGQEIRGETKVTFNGVDYGVAQVITASN